MIRQDVVATEYALTIFVNNKEMTTVVCTPEHLTELVVGFLASEGILRSIEQLTEFTLSTIKGIARVKTQSEVNFNEEFYNKRFLGSCCGKSRPSFYYYNDMQTALPVTSKAHIVAADVFSCMEEMEHSTPLFAETGGVHVAALCTPSAMQVSRTDIGRHNALDKLYGYTLLHKQPLDNALIAFSGRLSSEVLLKVAKIGVGIVLAKSAPTSLAIQLADELNITAIGFVRGDTFNVYTHAWRIDELST
ncbi:formate dehydrogenase accessory sulfurtransferase FdhD [Alicyclobacillaceae bacterium I2511]|nr:formate dehydrogenase accessory sulfurtransferase FdhD [Alicyclobacillaceae bacterium I2511]